MNLEKARAGNVAEEKNEQTGNVEDHELEFKDGKELMESFICPISQTLIKEPVSTKYGHLYEKEEIERWVKKYNTCPMTSKSLTMEDLHPQYAVKQAIQEY